MSDFTSDFETFVDAEGLSSADFEKVMELHEIASGGDSRGTYKVERQSDKLFVRSKGNGPDLKLTSPAAIEGFKLYLQGRFMKAAPDPDSWYAMQIAQKRDQ